MEPILQFNVVRPLRACGARRTVAVICRAHRASPSRKLLYGDENRLGRCAPIRSVWFMFKRLLRGVVAWQPPNEMWEPGTLKIATSQPPDATEESLGSSWWRKGSITCDYQWREVWWEWGRGGGGCETSGESWWGSVKGYNQNRFSQSFPCINPQQQR